MPPSRRRPLSGPDAPAPQHPDQQTYLSVCLPRLLRGFPTEDGTFLTPCVDLALLRIEISALPLEVV